MDGELGERLQAVLSDPEQMEKLKTMAESIFGQPSAPPESPGPAHAEPSASAAPPEAEKRLLAAIGKAFAGGGGKSRSTALLLAMRPYMKPEKQEKLDRALQIARMANIAGTVMREYGGGNGV